jgi:hypothetical protein
MNPALKKGDIVLVNKCIDYEKLRDKIVFITYILKLEILLHKNKKLKGF